MTPLPFLLLISLLLKNIGGVISPSFCRLLLGFEIRKERYRADNKMREVEWVGIFWMMMMTIIWMSS